ncbi:MAG: response regulator transcription factor [Anaerolineaceae bacterium]|nr:response regulator transcription factor [Anaerolineaceae bacterium]
MDKIHTLVVDDEPGIRFFVEETLHRSGHDVSSVKSGEEALEKLRDTPFDLVILDLKLGGKADGIKVLEGIRWRWPQTSVIIFTAHGSLDTAMQAIDHGIEKYVQKPLSPQELREVVDEVLAAKERTTIKTDENGQIMLQKGVFNVDEGLHRVVMGDKKLDLTPSEFTLIVHLLRNNDRVISPEELVEVVRGYKPDSVIEARQIIKWYIHRLRQKIEKDSSHPEFILNIRGVGYRIKPAQ